MNNSRSATARARPLAPIADAALRLAGAGWPVFPVKPRGKRPLTQHGFRDATTDRATVREWWNEWPDANIGLGIPEGVVVLDIDSPEALNELKARDFNLPGTLTVRTARGWHHYYRTKAGIRQTSGELFPGVDTKVAGKGYVIAPPSVHETGFEYELTAGDFGNPDSIAPAPSWLEEKFCSGSERFDLGRALRGFDQGERNKRLWRMTGSLRCRAYDQGETLRLVQRAADNCRPPYAEVEHVESMVERCYSSPTPTHSEYSEYSDDCEWTSEPDPRLPLGAFLIQAKAYSQPRKTCSRSFDFARQALQHPEFGRISDRERRDLLDDLWGEEMRWQIMSELEKVTVIPGTNPLEMASEMGLERPIYEDPHEPMYSRFLTFCYYLRDILRGQDIGLPCRKVGEMIGCNALTISHMRKEAEKAGLLTETRKATSWRATRFRLNVQKLNALPHRIRQVDS